MSAQSIRRSTAAAETNMNLDRPRLDELVPSRYALKVGEIDVLVISDGVVTPPTESMATNADPAVRAAWLDSMFLSRDAFHRVLDQWFEERTVALMQWPLMALNGHSIRRFEVAFRGKADIARARGYEC